MRKIAAVLALLALAGPAFAADKDVVEAAEAAGSFKTLVAAVEAAGLADTLKAEGPFTVLAPTDEAFKKLPPGTVEDLLKPENKARLAALLTYHVIQAKASTADVAKLAGKEVKSSEGSMIAVDVEGGKVKFNGKATVTKGDIPCRNGVIHAIDAVIMPPAK